MGIAAGQKLGNYQVVRKIGTGGMGEVWLAEHPVIGKQVALKVVHAELTSKEQVMRRFSTEARAVSAAAGEHVVPIHDYGTTPTGECFFVMDFIDGHTVARELRAGMPMAVERVVHIGAQIADALAAVHEHGILHRDLKPDNVMLTERHGDRDFVVLLDFGLAKFLGDDGPALTTAGMILGTPQYMSPEAAEGKSTVDHRADQYAAGILLYQMLTGDLPFDGASMATVLTQQVERDPPPLSTRRRAIPPAVERVVMRALAKRPEHRFADMRALGAALRDTRGHAGGAGNRPPAPSEARSGLLPGRKAEAMTAVQPGARSTEMMGGAPAAVDTTAVATRVDEPAVFGDRVQDGIAASASLAPPAGPEQTTVREIDAGSVGVTPSVAITRPYQSPVRPRRAGWGRWLVAGLAVLGAAVAVTALVVRGGASGEAMVGAGGGESGDEGGSEGGGEGGSGGERGGAASAGVVKLIVVSEPAGARVETEDGEVLGVTPLETTVPKAEGERSLRLVHPDAEPELKTYDASCDNALDVALDVRGSSDDRGRRGPKTRPASEQRRRLSPEELREDEVLRPAL